MVWQKSQRMLVAACGVFILGKGWGKDERRLPSEALRHQIEGLCRTIGRYYLRRINIVVPGNGPRSPGGIRLRVIPEQVQMLAQVFCQSFRHTTGCYIGAEIRLYLKSLMV